MREREKSIQKEFYFNSTYLRKERLQAYLDQIELLRKFATTEDKILEVGKGTGFLVDFFEKYHDTQIDTLDINPDLQADITDDIINPAKLKENSYDLVLAFEVLEHMEFEDSCKAFENMLKVARKYVMISVPDTSFYLNFNISWLFLKRRPFKKLINIPRFMLNKKTFGTGHHWEIGINKDGTSYSPQYVIRKMFGNARLVSHFRSPDYPGHHFFVAEKLK